MHHMTTTIFWCLLRNTSYTKDIPCSYAKMLAVAENIAKNYSCNQKKELYDTPTYASYKSYGNIPLTWVFHFVLLV